MTQKAAECVILLHLVAALPIVINPPSQFFEEILRIPKGQLLFSFILEKCAPFQKVKLKNKIQILGSKIVL